MNSTEFLEMVKPEIARYVSKFGNFDLIEDEIKQCNLRLSTEEVVSLYEYVRDESRRLEDEWRDEFVELFPNIEPFLPEVQF